MYMEKMEKQLMRNPLSILPGFQKHDLYELSTSYDVFVCFNKNIKNTFVFQNPSPYHKSLRKHNGDANIRFFHGVSQTFFRIVHDLPYFKDFHVFHMLGSAGGRSPLNIRYWPRAITISLVSCAMNSARFVAGVMLGGADSCYRPSPQ